MESFDEELNALEEQSLDEAKYKITAKGVLGTVLSDLGLITTKEFFGDKFKVIWELFEGRLHKSGFIILDRAFIKPVEDE